jgi:hypothetical protein
MSFWYVTETGSGAYNGTSMQNAWSASSFSDTRNWGVGKISAGDTVYLSGIFSSRLTVRGSGSNTSSRVELRGHPGTGCTLVGIDGLTFSYLSVISCSFTQQLSNNYECIVLRGADGWLVEDNYFYNTYGSAFDGRYNTVNNYHKIRCNTMYNCCGVNSGSSSQTIISIVGDFNVVEYNTFILGLDRTRLHGSNSIVRNNYFGPSEAALYPSSSPYPYHTDDFQSFGDPKRPTINKIILERNYSKDALDSIGGTNAHHLVIQTDQSQSNWFITRFNALDKIGGTMGIYESVNNIYGYNITGREIYSGSSGFFNTAISYETSSKLSTGSTWKNIAFYECRRLKGNAGILNTGSALANISNSCARIYAYNVDGGQPILPNNSNPGNLPQVDALFVNTASGDLRLQAASILRDSGSWITTATGSGTNSTTLIVVDSLPILDGWGLVDGDMVKAGSSSYSRVSSINYNTHTITLQSPITWNNGDPVYVFGMEDVGALPYHYAHPVLIKNTTANNATTLRATSSVSSSIRYVEFRINGLLVGQTTGSDGVYEISYTPTSGDRIESRAFSLWASQTPIVSDFTTYETSSIVMDYNYNPFIYSYSSMIFITA